MIRELLADLCLSRHGRKPQRLLLFVFVLALLAAVNGRFLAPGPTSLVDGHAVQAIELAMTQAFCGGPYAVPDQHRVPHHLRDHPEERQQPLASVASRMAGSLDAYCASATTPFVNNENSLTLVMTWLMLIDHDISIDQLGSRLHAIRLGLIVLFGATSVWGGLGVLAGVALVACGVVVHQLLAGSAHSLYPFLMPLLLLNTAAMVLESGVIRTRGWRSAAAASVALGMLASFSTNMRTSYLPIYIAMLAVVLFVPCFGWSASRVRRTGIAIGAYAIAFASFQYVAIDRHLPAVNNFNASYHTVAHPLVLSLAVPPTDLSRREGIEWSDGAGIAIAQRIIPDVGYLSPAYDTALFQYYRHLWRAFPEEMIALYVGKFSMVGTPIIDSFDAWRGIEGRLFRLLVWPFTLVRNGILLLFLLAIVAIFTLSAGARHASRVPLCAGLLSFSAALLLIESAVIMPFYRLQYHGFLTVAFPMLSVLAIQGALDRVVASRAPLPSSTSQSSRKTAMYFDAIHADFASRMNPFDLDARLAWFDRAFNRYPLVGRVLDVGAGLGHFSDLASSRDVRVAPLDIAPRLVAKLHERHTKAVCGSAIELPFCDGTFDAVISSECIEHTPDPALAVSECLRVLKPGGRLYLTTPNFVWRWSISVAEWLRIRKFEGIENWLSRPALRRTVERCGASVELTEGLHILPFQLRPLWPLIHWFNLHGQWGRAVMINQCWIVRK